MKRALSIALFCVVARAAAAPVTGWVDRLNNGMILSAADTASPVMGDGSANNATAQSIHAAFPAITLSSIGDKITLSGSATLTGINNPTSTTNYNNQFRWALFDVNGSANDTGWLGYSQAAGSGSSGGALVERVNPNTSTYFSTTGGMAATLVTAAAPGTGLTASTYTFELSIERVASGVQLNASIVRTSDSQVFASASFLDATPTPAVFNRAAFLSGSALNADQISFANVDVTFTSAPLPPAAPTGPPLLGIDFNRSDALAAPSQSGFRILAGSAVQAQNAPAYMKNIGARQVTMTQPGGVNFEFRGANGDASRAIPGGDTSLAFLVADFIATRQGALDITITGLAAGDYIFRSWHLDTFTNGPLGFAQGVNTTTPNTLEARMGGTMRATVQPTALGSSGLNTTYISNAQIPTLQFTFSHDGTAPLVIELRATQTNGTDSFLLLNGFGLYPANP